MGILASGCLVSAAAQADPGLAASDQFPEVDSKKGLQVELADDAIALGVRHAAINVDLSRLIAPAAAPGAGDRYLQREHGGRSFAWRTDYLHALEGTIRQLHDGGALVYVILLTYEQPDPRVNQIMLHPDYDPTAPNHLGAWNFRTDDGRAWLAATLDLLAERWSGGEESSGEVAGYIVSNEVNSHWYWHNQGRAGLQQVVADYADAVRLVHTAVRRHAAWPRVYLSLDHHWGIAYPAGGADQCLAGKDFVDAFARCVKQAPGGDFDWHVAYHPYPENLFEPRFWQDKSATAAPDTPRITFKNLEVLTTYLERPELLHDGRPRRVILSEQGFHSPPGEEGETLQAAAYCYAYAKVDRLAGVDAFILHRHIDHPHEGGLNLGLRRRTPGAADSHPKKKIYDCFRAAGTPEWEAASAFALPVVGLESWDEAGR
ncbi:hypothetical protein Pla123a_09590 [Posidoniimonas polymericola]|uniref:DUF5722 domain-containing protein n=1 Tax=Posidoniimonas polymericola TaxID=2528002 RepID=A0A5C5YT62_9BACT|nr:hypothetical protein Pla123a_09590 [Posidoniimonas polymericola]